jgi:hypothetical protein
MEARQYLEFLVRARAGTLEEISVLTWPVIERREPWTKDQLAQYRGLAQRLNAIDVQIARIEHELKAEAEAARATKAARLREIKAAKQQQARNAVVKPESKEITPELTLPIPVTEVDALPTYLDHTLVDTIQQRAKALVEWNYFSLGSRHRSSRRYEGFGRSR